MFFKTEELIDFRFINSILIPLDAKKSAYWAIRYFVLLFSRLRLVITSSPYAGLSV
jgi:hypothetical protein